MEKLEEMLAIAAEKPKGRIATEPPEIAKEYRIQEKKHRSAIKQSRRVRSDHD